MRAHAALLFAFALATGACAGAPSDDPGAGSTTEDPIAGDRSDPAHARGDRAAATSTLFGRSFVLHVSDADDAAWGSIDDGNPGDQVWLDRSFDNGAGWDGRIGLTSIPSGRRGWRTMMYRIDDPSRVSVGAVRACGKAGDRVEITCTHWVRSAAHDGDRLDRATASMMALYDGKSGLFQSIGWWNSANALTAMIDYSAATGSSIYRPAIGFTFDHNRHDDFTNDYLDDTGWWGLAWVRAYALTHEARYLDMAKRDADWMWSYTDSRCGGGVWWRTKKDYKNAIPNELFIELAAAIHNQSPGDTVYLARAKTVWSWFEGSGMINGSNLVNDGLDFATCKNNNDTPWTYNQGVILGGLGELYDATGDATYLTKARALADASTTSTQIHVDGILHEPCESSTAADACGGDAPVFKGVYVRNLRELDDRLADHPYRAYLTRQAAAIAAHDAGPVDTYGMRWGGPFDRSDASRQQSVVDAFVAAR